MTALDKAGLVGLAERVEALAGACRETDCLVFCAMAHDHSPFEYHGGECVLAVMGGFSARLDWADLPHVTASLDAAMTLAADERTAKFGGALAMLRWAIDGLARYGKSIDALPRYVTAAALRAIAAGQP